MRPVGQQWWKSKLDNIPQASPHELAQARTRQAPGVLVKVALSELEHYLQLGGVAVIDRLRLGNVAVGRKSAMKACQS